MYICPIVSIYYDDYEADLFSRLSLFLYSSVIIIIRKLHFGVKEESNLINILIAYSNREWTDRKLFWTKLKNQLIINKISTKWF